MSRMLFFRAFFLCQCWLTAFVILTSPFRKFIVKCLQCECVKLKLTINYDEESGETFVVFYCTRCRQHEKVVPLG